VYSFQITIDDLVTAKTVNATQVYFEHNFHGIVQNMTASGNVSSAYYFNMTAYNYTGAGTYSYRWYARNNSGEAGVGVWNKSAVYAYTIAQNTTTNKVHCYMVVYGTSSSATTATNANANSCEGRGEPYAYCKYYVEPATYITGGTAKLYRDNVEKTNNTSDGSLPQGTYVYECNITATTNYTANSTGCSYNMTMLACGGGGSGNGGTVGGTSSVSTTVPIWQPGATVTLPEWQLPNIFGNLQANLQTWVNNIILQIRALLWTNLGGI